MQANALCRLLDKTQLMFPDYEVKQVTENYLILADKDGCQVMIDSDGNVELFGVNYVNPNKEGPH